MSTVSMAFSGSGFKVPAHVGALRAVIAAQNEIVEVAGTSGGSIVAAFYACGMSPGEMENLVMTENWSDMIEFNTWALIKHGSYCSGKALSDFLKKHTKNKTFKDLKIPLKVIATDIFTKEQFVFSQETTPDAPVWLAVRASSSLPFVYSPVEYQGKLLMDGGIINNIPVDKLNAASDIKIGVNLVANDITKAKKKDLKYPWNVVKELVGIMMSASENMHIHAAVSQGAKIAYVETGFANGLDDSMDKETRMKLLDSGFDATKFILLKKEG